jgi:hypothetical protein
MRFVVLLAFLLASCTSYGRGVESNWVSQKTLRVSGEGNGLTTDGRIEDYVMLKAAEQAFEAGFKYFVMTSSENTGGVEQYTVNTPYHTTVSARTYGGFYGGSTTFATATTTGGPQSYSIYKPGRDAVFVMFDEIPRGYRPSQYFEVVSVYNELGQKYIKNFIPVQAVDKSSFVGEMKNTRELIAPATFDTQNELNVERGAAAFQPTLASENPDVPTLDELYRSLSAREKSMVNSLPPGKRADYLQEIRNLRY